MRGESGAEAPPSGARRFARLAGMTAAVAARHAGSRLRSAFQSGATRALDRALLAQSNGELIARTLGELKGAAMKLGQMASIGDDMLPKELTSALQSLQRHAPPVPYETIAEQIRTELGAAPEQLFSRFDRQPFAAASIGQVHRARMDDGREVVVKVQYPGVDRSVSSDLTHLKVALKASGILRGALRNLDDLFVEISIRLKEELDYCNEADNVRTFRKFHAQHAFMVVPAVVGERSSQRILTLEFEPGDALAAVTDGPESYPQSLRDELGSRFVQMTFAQIFELGIVHADPNPANFAFRRDGRIVLYDFGCVKEVKPRILAAYAEIMRSAIAEDYAAIDRGLIALGVRRPDAPPLEAEFYKPWRDALLALYAGETYDYATARVHEELRPLFVGAIRRMSSFQAAVEAVFVDRAMVGLYGNMRKLGARVPVRGILQPYVEAAWASAARV